MNDRELLEKVAKVVGLDGYIHEWINGPEFIIPGENPVTWNPLTDDGDAMRLAVKLRILVSPESNYVNAINDLGAERCEMYSDHDGDAMAATRRAITRAAAAMAND